MQFLFDLSQLKWVIFECSFQLWIRNYARISVKSPRVLSHCPPVPLSPCPTVHRLWDRTMWMTSSLQSAVVSQQTVGTGSDSHNRTGFCSRCPIKNTQSKPYSHSLSATLCSQPNDMDAMWTTCSPPPHWPQPFNLWHNWPQTAREGEGYSLNID